MTAISEARVAVLKRDGFHCIARSLDPDAGDCYDSWGRWFSGFDPTGVRLEVDRVPPESGSRKARHELSATMALLCAGHHRGTGPNAGRAWALANRPLLREYLRAVSVA